MPNSPILSGKRGSSPTEWVRTNWTIGAAREVGLYPPLEQGGAVTDAFSFDFTWHHNIPWATLRDSWNVVFAFCDWDVVDGLLTLYGGNGMPRVRAGLQAMRDALLPGEAELGGRTFAALMERFASGPGSALDGLPEEQQLAKTDADELHTNVAWQRWNIVEGPKESIRCEDPGDDDFDDFSRADTLNFSRYQAIELLYHALEDVLKDYNVKKNAVATVATMRDNWSVKLRGPVVGAQFLVAAPLRMFDHRMWRRMQYGAKPLTVKLNPKEYYLVRTRRADESY